MRNNNKVSRYRNDNLQWDGCFQKSLKAREDAEDCFTGYLNGLTDYSVDTKFQKFAKSHAYVYFTCFIHRFMVRRKHTVVRHVIYRFYYRIKCSKKLTFIYWKRISYSSGTQHSRFHNSEQDLLIWTSKRCVHRTRSAPFFSFSKWEYWWEVPYQSDYHRIM